MMIVLRVCVSASLSRSRYGKMESRLSSAISQHEAGFPLSVTGRWYNNLFPGKHFGTEILSPRNSQCQRWDLPLDAVTMLELEE